MFLYVPVCILKEHLQLYSWQERLYRKQPVFLNVAKQEEGNA